MASLSKKTVLVFLGLILSLALLEGGLRLGGFILSSIQEYGNLRSIKQKGAYRILCLGESTTERQYPHLLEQVLNQRNIGVRFSVIDKGKAGTDSSILLSQVKSYLAEYRPDMVVAMMGTNDKGIQYYQDLPESGTWLFRHCRVYRFGRIIAMHILKKIKQEDIYGLDLKGTRYGLGIPSQGREAEESFKKAIELDPKDDRNYVGLGELYLKQVKLSQAEALFKKAIEINSKNDKAYDGLGDLYLQQRKLSQAGDSFKKAFKLTKNGNNYARLGWFYRNEGELQKAEDLFREIIESNPNNVQAYFDLGWVYRVQGKLLQAEEAFKRNIDSKTAKNDPRALGAMATLLDEMGKPALAKEYAEKARQARFWECRSITADNYHRLKAILDKRGIRLVCVQYPMRSLKPLERIFKKDEGVIFVDNEKIFKTAVRKEGFTEYFWDMFAGDFGHCTPKGNMLLAQNIADGILRGVFNKR